MTKRVYICQIHWIMVCKICYHKSQELAGIVQYNWQYLIKCFDSLNFQILILSIVSIVPEIFHWQIIPIPVIDACISIPDLPFTK